MASMDDAAPRPVWIIVGASRGIGLEFVRQVAATGALVHATYRTTIPTAAEGLDVRWHQLDVLRRAHAEALAEAVGPWDVLVHSAGIKCADRGEMVRVNSLAPFTITDSLVPTAGAGAKLVLLSSQLGSRVKFGGGEDKVNGGHTPRDGYGKSKCLMNDCYRESVKGWRELGVASCVVHPGWVATDMGGSSAPVTVEASVAGLRRVVASLAAGAPADGAFLTYEGEPHPW
jgi:NAD(P)-dependent dehydrogenase (short-subunit alcohol dehydrogenase family)